tara:strand:+ start:78 stop:368 length:291 start_codon:yes stop_codon:yes gene_type:complete
VSVDHLTATKAPDAAKPGFLDVKPGMTVIVRNDERPGETQDKEWWMGEVIHCGGAARDPSIYNLFQVADVDSGVIRWVNADLVTHILPDKRCDQTE